MFIELLKILLGCVKIMGFKARMARILVLHPLWLFFYPQVDSICTQSGIISENPVMFCGM